MPGVTLLSLGEGNASLNCGENRELQKLMILYRLIRGESVLVYGGKPSGLPHWLWKIQGYLVR